VEREAAFYTDAAESSIDTAAWQVEVQRAALDKPGTSL